MDVGKGEKVVIKMENIEKDVQKGRKQIEKEKESREEV